MNEPLFKMSETNKARKKTEQEKFSEGIDYYFDNGLMVLTAHFLLKRGYCCGNGCRHCPYQKQADDSLQKKSV